MTGRSLVVLASALLFTVSTRAHAYCRTTTCDRVDAPPECLQASGGCSSLGKPIAWPDTCVSTSVSAFGSAASGITADDLRSVVNEAFKKWTSAPCDGGTPRFSVDLFPDVRCLDVTGESGYKEKGPNYNIWIFQDTVWPYDAVGENAIAITTTQFHPTTGEIYDSDVELNSLGNVFTLSRTYVQIDLPSVVLHEAGHFLGLAHSNQLSAAVMSPTLEAGDASRRNLDPDDILGICSVYPPGPLNPSCDPEPRHGFSTECGMTNSSCAVSRRRATHQNTGGTLFLAGLLLVATCRRRAVRRGRFLSNL
jgi:hypothetical protein